METIAIDPGPDHSGVVLLDDLWPPTVLMAAPSLPTADLLAVVEGSGGTRRVVCEWLTCYGLPVGASVLDTARVVGRVEQAALPAEMALMIRPDVALELCQSRRATDAQIHEAIRSLYPPTGGGMRPVVGTRVQPGPLYSVRRHAWDALAVGLAWLRQRGDR